MPAPPMDLDAHPAFRQALADGVERGFEGELPSLPDSAELYLLQAAAEDVGLVAIQRDCPRPGAAAVLALAIDPAHRGHAYATKALLAAERRLTTEGVERLMTRVPRTNGRGLYFMLRVGYTPIADPPAGDATWFERAGSR